jgi:hypothetical protein
MSPDRNRKQAYALKGTVLRNKCDIMTWDGNLKLQVALRFFKILESPAKSLLVFKEGCSPCKGDFNDSMDFAFRLACVVIETLSPVPGMLTHDARPSCQRHAVNFSADC